MASESGGKAPPLTEHEHHVFATETVDDVRQMERETWIRADQKKEELRQLVGLRYRDLLDSADAIIEMKGISEDTIKLWSGIQRELRALSDLTEKSDVEVLNELGGDLSGGIAVEAVDDAMRLLAGSSEELWSLVESGDFLGACVFFWRVRHCHHHLRRDKQVLHAAFNDKNQQRKLVFIGQEWNSVRSFPSIIAEEARHCLSGPGACEDFSNALAGLLVSSHICEDQSHGLTTAALLSEFLTLRTTCVLGRLKQAMHGLRNLDLDESQHTPGDSAPLVVRDGDRLFSGACLHTPTQIVAHGLREAAASIVRVFVHVDALFCAEKKDQTEEPDGTVSVVDLAGSYVESVGRDQAPRSLLEVREISADTVRTTCRSWLSECARETKGIVVELLQSVKSGEFLAAVRDSVLGRLGMSIHMECDEPGLSWTRLSARIVGERVSLWKEVFSDAFLDRGRQIISTSFQELPACISNMLDVGLESIRLQSQSSAGESTATKLDTTIVVFSPPRKGGALGFNLSVGSPGESLKQKLNFGSPRKDDDEKGSEREERGGQGSELLHKPPASGVVEREENVDEMTQDDEAGLMSSQAQEICEHFEQQLSVLLHDLRFLLVIPEVHIPFEQKPESDKLPGPLERDAWKTKAAKHADEVAALQKAVDEAGMASFRHDIQEGLSPFLRRTCTESISEIVRALQERLTLIQNRIFDILLPREALKHVDQAVFVARVCNMLLQNSLDAEEADVNGDSLPRQFPLHTPPEHPPNLMVPLPLPLPSRTLRDIKLVESVTHTKRSAAFAYIQRSLRSTAHFGFRIWTRFVASKLGDGFRADLQRWIHNAGASPQSIVYKCAVEKHTWVPVAVKEQDTTLLVPAHPSPHIISTLFLLSQELYRVNGSVLDMYIIRSLASDVLEAVLDIFESLLTNKTDLESSFDLGLGKHDFSTLAAGRRLDALSEDACIQLWFDIKVLLTVLDVNALGLKGVAGSTRDADLGLVTPAEDSRDLVRRVEALSAVVAGQVDAVERITLLPHICTHAEHAYNATRVMFGSLSVLHAEVLRRRSNKVHQAPRAASRGSGNTVLLGQPIPLIPVFLVSLYPILSSESQA